MTRAEALCDEFDASVFSGDAFIDHSGAKVLKEFAERWLRAAEETLSHPDLEGDEDGEL